MPANDLHLQDSPAPAPLRIRAALPAAALGTLALALLALNDQSLWIDELGTWRLTVAASLADWLRQFVSWPSSDAQIPLYHLYMRLWASVFAPTEIGLRAANLPWLFAGMLALLTTPAPATARRFVLLMTGVVFLHPMVWYYANEARPYALIIAGSCIAASGLLARLLDAGDTRARPAANSRLIAGSALLAATSIVGLLWSIAFLLPVIAFTLAEGMPSLRFTARNRTVAVVCCLLLVPVAYQYASTVTRGVGATALHENTLQSFASGLYEVAGFGGIGPGREQLRTDGTHALAPFAAPLALFGFAIGLATVVGMRAVGRRSGRRLAILLFAAAVPLVLFFVLGTVKHWRVLGRHMVPLLVVFAYFLAMGIQELARWRSGPIGSACARGAAAAALLALAASSMEIAHAQRHRREDVRAAAQRAAEYLHAGNRVWWVGLWFGAEYYGLPIVQSFQCAEPGKAAAVVLEGPSAAALKDCAAPDVIVLERPDTYDLDGAVRQYADAQGFRSVATLQGFEILERSAAPAR